MRRTEWYWWCGRGTAKPGVLNLGHVIAYKEYVRDGGVDDSGTVVWLAGAAAPIEIAASFETFHATMKAYEADTAERPKTNPLPKDNV